MKNRSLYEEENAPFEKQTKIKIKLANGKEHLIKHAITTTFIGPGGKPMTVQEFLNSLYGKLPDLFKSEAELKKIWSNPITRKIFAGQTG